MILSMILNGRLALHLWLFSYAAMMPQGVWGQSTSVLSRCPVQCSESGMDPDAWTYYHDMNALANCNATVLFEMNIYNPINDPKTHVSYRACTASGTRTRFGNDHDGEIAKRQVLSFNSSMEIEAPVHTASWGTATSSSQAGIASAAAELSDYLTGDTYSTNLFARSNTVIAGLYAGTAVRKTSAASIIDKFVDQLSTASVARRVAAQSCGAGNQTIAPNFFGIVFDTNGDVSAVQDALKSWNDAECLTDSDEDSILEGASLSLIPGNQVSIVPSTNEDGAPINSRSIFRRDTCKYIQAQSGDGCYALAERCGITTDELYSYNGGSSFCNTLQVGDYVCCSSGSKPDFSPQPDSNGNCFAYTIQANDTCSDIANSHQMKLDGIENNNKNTWGWMGCTDLLIGQKICLSSGNPPFPANVPNAVCGPQINNTAMPSDPSTWSDLNPCPLNACCDIWGQCGITSDFCTPSPGDTGAPGTAQPGSNGCISNCGTDIVSSAPPSSFSRVGYYEAFNYGRPCLHMAPGDISSSYYTHIHFAFANITDDYDVEVSGFQDIWDEFLQTSGFKKIVSFGGWAFSTDPQTYPIFRQGVTPAQRQTFANNVALFVQKNKLDGVDFDWEYPSAPDIPGIPPGSPEDGANYLDFLKLVRQALPSQYTVSIAAPASYWYLKGFPIADISKTIDYIIYMTYDLHGQWDYGNDFTDPGCPAGNCLRSQINHTETEQAFSMITKAGVPANMIMVGQPLYGRSFQMTDPGCYTEQCTYTGPSSGATPGRCTGTAGYISNYEINDIINSGDHSVQQYYSEDSGDILVYDGDQWVSWMKQSTYNSRSSWAQGLGFGGTSDWAVDLNQSYSDDGSSEGDGSGVVYIDPQVLTQSDPTIACTPPCTFVFPPWILSTPTTISQPPTTITVQDLWTSVESLSGGMTTTVYVSKTTVTTITIPPLTTDTISLWNVEWTDTDQDTIYLTSSISFPPVTLTEGSDVVTTTGSSTTSTTTLAGIIFTYKPGPFPPQTGPANGNPTTTPVPPGPPPPGSAGSVHVTVGPPSPVCKSGCGHLCESNCAPEIPCIGICGCIGLGCPGGGGCIGPGCSGSDNGGGGGGDGGDDDPTTCETSTTVTDCRVDCSATDFGDTSYTSNCYRTSCSEVVTCASIGSTTTSVTETSVCPLTTFAYSTWSPQDPNAQLPFLGSNNEFTSANGQNAGNPSYISCSTQNQDPDQGITAAYCVCSGSTFPQSTNTQVTPANSCAYTTVPAKTTDVSVSTSVTTDSAHCQVCTYSGNMAQCNSLSGCTTSQPITPPPAYPTISNAETGHALCYSSPYKEFNSASAMDAVTQLCNMHNTLMPGQTYPYVEAQGNPGGTTVYAEIGWASDQSGCSPKSNFPLEGQRCFDVFNLIAEDCPPNGEVENGDGGGWVYDYEYGCILVTLGAPDYDD